jgi:hypothetical protein
MEEEKNVKAVAGTRSENVSGTFQKSYLDLKLFEMSEIQDK